MQDAVRLANMDDGGKTMDHSAAIGLRLSLGGNKTLTIGEKDLVLFGMATLGGMIAIETWIAACPLHCIGG
jgi:hypothetical protein